MNQLDHPLIILFQVLTALAMFKLFFEVRKVPAPLPQFVGLLAVAISVCASARLGHRQWFFIPDIVQYGIWFASTIAAVYTRQIEKKALASIPGAKVVVPDTLDRLGNKIVWALALIAGIWVISDYVGTYNDKRKAEVELTATAIKVYASATSDYAKKEEKKDSTLGTVVAALTSISATQSTILANQKANKDALLTSNAELKKEVKSQNATVKKTIQSSVIQARPIENKPKETPVERPNLWQRFKGAIHVRADTTVQYSVLPDTLAYQREQW